MKLCFIAIAIISFQSAFAAPTNTVINNGSWSNNNTWDLGRKPQHGDTVMIPAGKRVTIDNNQNYAGSFMYVRIYGIMKLDGGKLTLNDYSVIVVHANGTLMGNGGASEKIKIGNNEVFRGNESPVNGPRIANISTNNFMAFTELPMPVKFISYTVSIKNKNVLVQWATSEELNASVYGVERSFNGIAWNTISYQPAAGNTSAITNYSYTDKNFSKTAYYRIKQVDIDGKFTFTPVQFVKFDLNSVAKVTIAAMPQSKILLKFSQEICTGVIVRLTSLDGKLVFRHTLYQPSGEIILNTNASLKGNYVVSVNGEETHTATQVIL